VWYQKDALPQLFLNFVSDQAIMEVQEGKEE
jgi:hypothetical protein